MPQSKYFINTIICGLPRPKHFYIIPAYVYLGAWGSRVWRLGVRALIIMRKDTERYIHKRKRKTHSVDEQVAIAHAMWDKNILPHHDGLKTNEIEEKLGLDLEYEPDTSVSHLDDAGIVERFGSYPLAIAEWMDGGEGKVVNGEVKEAARQGLDGLKADLEPASSESSEETVADGGKTIRSVIASELDHALATVEDHLATTSNPVDDLNDAVEAIEENDDVETSDEYGEISFINRAYRHRLTEKAVRLYKQ